MKYAKRGITSVSELNGWPRCTIRVDWIKTNVPTSSRRSFWGSNRQFLSRSNAPSGKADIAWLVYDLSFDPAQNRYDLTHYQTVYTAFTPALETITTAEAGPVEGFVEHLQQKLDEKLENGYPPDAPSLTDFIEE